MRRVGLIAGNGSFPILFARTARAEGVEVIAVGHEGETEPDLAEHVESLTWVRVGQLEAIIRAFKENGVGCAVMAGGIRKAALMERFSPDARALAFLSRLGTWSDDAVLRGVAGEIESEGIEVVDSTLFLGSILTPEGPLTSRVPSESEWRDVRYGFAVAKGIGHWDVGQTVVVKSGIVLAIEALEGTDAALARGGELGCGGAVAVKASKPRQDLRFDVPAVGPRTVPVCAGAGIAVLALEAGKTLLLERETVLAAAEAAGLAVVGVRADD